MFIDKDVDPKQFKEDLRSMGPKEIINVENDRRFRPAILKEEEYEDVEEEEEMEEEIQDDYEDGDEQF